uniref:Reverse transcriptase domain-containing protein n=1 Tax=Steinernema glaseri TaxID=37863 RepID=A0A1I7ZAU1_9BILA
MEGVRRYLSGNFYIYVDDIILASSKEEEHLRQCVKCVKSSIRVSFDSKCMEVVTNIGSPEDYWTEEFSAFYMADFTSAKSRRSLIEMKFLSIKIGASSTSTNIVTLTTIATDHVLIVVKRSKPKKEDIMTSIK